MIINTPIGFATAENSVGRNKYIPSDHLLLLEQKLLKVYSGEIKRLIVSMPPRHGKSLLISEYFPFWWLLNRPDDNIIISSYGLQLAEKWSLKTKEHFKKYAKVNNYEVEIDRNDYWTVKGHRGGLTAVGVGGSITGKGANLFIIDDPIKNDEQALSPTYREKTWNWFKSTAYTRLEPNGAFIIIMTRWHYDDLVGRVLKMNEEDGEKWEMLELPAFATENDELGREKGEALFPARFDENRLEEIKKTLGSYFFSALYQQQPIDNEHNIFQRDWWNFYTHSYNMSFDITIQVWDTAFEKGKENDYSVCATWGLIGDEFYLIDLYRKKMLFPELTEASIKLYNQHKPKYVFIEDAGSGKSLVQTLKIQTKLPVKPVKTMDKSVRAHSVTPVIEQGRVFLPEKRDFIDDFLNEHNLFPSAKHDDIVDTTTIALQILTSVKKPQKLNTSKILRSNPTKYDNYN